MVSGRPGQPSSTTATCYSGDHVVEQDHLVGNITTTHLLALVSSLGSAASGQPNTRRCRSTASIATPASAAPASAQGTDSRPPLTARAGAQLPLRRLQGVLPHIDCIMRRMADRSRAGGYADEARTVLTTAGTTIRATTAARRPSNCHQAAPRGPLRPLSAPSRRVDQRRRDSQSLNGTSPLRVSDPTSGRGIGRRERKQGSETISGADAGRILRSRRRQTVRRTVRGLPIAFGCLRIGGLTTTRGASQSSFRFRRLAIDGSAPTRHSIASSAMSTAPASPCAAVRERNASAYHPVDAPENAG